MATSKRSFIRYVGLMLGSILATRCAPTCYTQTPPTPTPLSSGDPLWEALRVCWMDLQDPRLQTFEDTDFTRELRRRHADALAALVAEEGLHPTVAENIGIAFEQGMAHVQRQMASCYMLIPPEFAPREELVNQVAVLGEMAATSEIDPSTVARAQEALERDIAWLAEFEAGMVPEELDDVHAGWEEVEAARILVELLLYGQ